MYTNKGNSSYINSLADSVVRGDFSEHSRLVNDICRLFIQFNAEGYVAIRDTIVEDDRKTVCNATVEDAAERFYTEIVPETFSAYQSDMGPIPEDEEIQIYGLLADAFAIYLKGLPLAMAIFRADETFADDPEREGVEIKKDRFEQIEAIYLDEGVAEQLSLSDDEIEAYLEMLITETTKRFDPNSTEFEMFRPCTIVAKNQEKYFQKLAETFGWGRTEYARGYVVFN